MDPGPDRPTAAVGSVDELLALVRSADPGTGDDVVAFLDHGLQCAAVLADRAPDDLELQAAGLVHDVGHLVDPDAVDRHGVNGGALVEPLLGSRVARLVELHVPAKRYLVAVDPGYRAGLSAGSVWTLGEQGGAMTAEEVAAFEADPLAADAVTLRRADEAAKDVHRVVPGLERWRPVLEAVAGRDR